MTDQQRTEEKPEFSAAALDEWERLIENVLRGIAHSLNNRAAALSAAVELVRDPTEDESTVTSILGTELERVTELVAILRAISVPRPSEAFSPADAAKDVLTVLRVHAEHRDCRFSLEAGGADPIRVPRWLFVRAMVALGSSAARSTKDVTIKADVHDDWFVARVPATKDAARSVYLTEAARAMNGETFSEADAVGFRIPTLAAIRRREGRAG